jgi:hypothetical protein
MGSLLPPSPKDDGMVEFVVGTGGEDNYPMAGILDPALVASLAAVGTNPSPGVFGALKLGLHPAGYDWSFVNAVGSDFSDSGSAGCRAKNPPTGVPTAPSMLALARAGDGAVAVSWAASSSTPPEPIEYTVNVVDSAHKCVVTAATTCTVVGLTNGREYRFTVTARTSIASATSNVSDPIIPAVKPGRPTSVTAAALGGGDARISWSPPTSNGGMPVTRYTVIANKSAGQCVTTDPAPTSCTIHGIKPGTGYSFSAVATNEVGDSPASVGTPGITIS